MDKIARVSVILPCLNEAEAISRVLTPLRLAVDQLLLARRLEECEVIVVNDGSTDDSLSLLQNYRWVKVISHPEQKGYGAALKSGITAAKGDWIIFFDLDGSYDAKDLAKLLPGSDSSGVDFIFGERFSLGSGMPLLRVFGNHFFTIVVRALSGKSIVDACSGSRGFHSRWVGKLLAIPQNGLDFCLALTLLALGSGARCQEVPIRYFRRSGHSKLNEISDGLYFLRTIFAYYLVPRPLALLRMMRR